MAKDAAGNEIPEVVDPKGPAPAIDLNSEAFKKAVAEQVQQHMATVDKDNVDLGDPARVAPVAAVNPLEAVLDPIIGPKLRAANLKADGAYDASLFYATHPEALPHKDKIELAFKALIDQGTPFNHEAVWDWYWGKNKAQFIKEAIDAHDKKIAAAEGANTIGGGVRAAAGSPREARELPQEDLGKALAGVSF